MYRLVTKRKEERVEERERDSQSRAISDSRLGLRLVSKYGIFLGLRGVVPTHFTIGRG